MDLFSKSLKGCSSSRLDYKASERNMITPEPLLEPGVSGLKAVSLCLACSVTEIFNVYNVTLCITLSTPKLTSIVSNMSDFSHQSYSMLSGEKGSRTQIIHQWTPHVFFTGGIPLA